MLKFISGREVLHRLFITGLLTGLLTACGMESARQAALPQEITLLTHNLHAEPDIVQPFADIIRESGADIVALQEVSRAAAALFEQELGEVYPYQVTALASGRYNGQAILSRYPILKQESWEHERRLLRVVVDVNSVPVTVYNVHPTSPGTTGMSTTQRSSDITFMLEQAAQETNLTILMGDFNSESWSGDYKTVATTFEDAFATVGEGSGVTYPDYSQPQSRVNARLPAFTPLLIRLDYIFYSVGFTPLSARVWPSSGGSDHRPVVATLRLDGTS
ncbi:MAG: endonuclease/exonuclease/phosphatase family protein [Anaerolineaceae bacterium]|nr:endonuclease/exonuclease/phosphatase family protein [Anaerolineaceae bacterium]